MFIEYLNFIFLIFKENYKISNYLSSSVSYEFVYIYIFVFLRLHKIMLEIIFNHLF